MAFTFRVSSFFIAAISTVLFSYSVHAESVRQLTVCAGRSSLLVPIFNSVFDEKFYKLLIIQSVPPATCDIGRTCDVFVMTDDINNLFSSILPSTCNIRCSIISKTQEVFVINANPERILPSIRAVFDGQKVNYKTISLKNPYSTAEFAKKLKAAVINSANHRDQLQNQISKLAVLEAERAQKEFTKTAKSNYQDAACADPVPKQHLINQRSKPKLCDYFQWVEKERIPLSAFLSEYLKNNSAESLMGLIESGVLWQYGPVKLSNVDKNHPLAKLFHSRLKSAQSFLEIRSILNVLKNLHLLNQFISTSELSKLISKFIETRSGSADVEEACSIISSFNFNRNVFNFLTSRFLAKAENEGLLKCLLDLDNDNFTETFIPFLEEKDLELKYKALLLAATTKLQKGDNAYKLSKELINHLDTTDPSLRLRIINQLDEAQLYLEDKVVPDFYNQLYLNLSSENDLQKNASTEILSRITPSIFNKLPDDLKNKLSSFFDTYKTSNNSQQKLLGLTFFSNRIFDDTGDIKYQGHLEPLVSSILNDPNISEEQKLNSLSVLNFSEFKNQDHYINAFRNIHKRIATKKPSSSTQEDQDDQYYQLNKIFLSFSKQNPQLDNYFESALKDTVNSVQLYRALDVIHENQIPRYPNIAELLVKHRVTYYERQGASAPVEHSIIDDAAGQRPLPASSIIENMNETSIKDSNNAIASLALLGLFPQDLLDNLTGKLRNSNLNHAKIARSILTAIYRAEFSVDLSGKRKMVSKTSKDWSYTDTLKRRIAIFKELTKKFHDLAPGNRIEILGVLVTLLPADILSIEELLKIEQHPTSTSEEKTIIYKVLGEVVADAGRQMNLQASNQTASKKPVKSSQPILHKLYTLLMSDQIADKVLGLNILNSRGNAAGDSLPLPTIFSDLIRDLRSSQDPQVSALAKSLSGKYTITHELDVYSEQ